MARNQYNFAKRQREIEKKKKKEAKMERKLGKKDSPGDEIADSTAAQGSVGADDEEQV